MNTPVYLFKGYSLLSANIQRSKMTNPTQFETRVIDTRYTEENSLYIMFIEVSVQFAKEETKSSLLFASHYFINDREWMNSIDKVQLDSLFFAAVFPFIRQKVFAITDDSSGAVILPIIDLRSADLKKGIILRASN